MAQAATAYEHIVLDEKGVPVIAGANTKVVELAEELYSYGWSPAEMHFQHPHLTLGQIHSALAYYWDHQQELDRDIARDLEIVDELRRRTPEAPIVPRLRAHQAD